MLDGLLANLFHAPWGSIQLAPGWWISFDFVLYPDKPVGPCGLETEIAAPYPRRYRSHRKQSHLQQQQQQRQHPDILRQHRQIEKMKLAMLDIKQNGLLAVPAQIGNKEEQQPERL